MCRHLAPNCFCRHIFFNCLSSMVLRSALRRNVRKVWKKPHLLKGTGPISRSLAIKSLITLSPLKLHSNETKPKYHCSRKECHQRVHPQYLHPLFQAGRGPEVQAAILLLLITRVSLASIHLLLGINHKVVENMQKRLEEIRKKHVQRKEGDIVFGASKTWVDVEGDEATFDKRDISTDPDAAEQVHDGRCLLWEQWSGLVQRGKPSTLVLSRLDPSLTVPRAPGPGPITKQNWAPLGQKWLANRKVIFHTDSAKAYKLKLPNVIHDSVVHQKNV